MRHHQATKIRRGVVLTMKIVSIVLLCFVGVAFLSSLLLSPATEPPWPLLILVAVCVYAFASDHVNAWLWGRRFEKRPDADIEIEWEFSKEEIRTGSALGATTLQWKGLAKAVEASDGFLLYPFERLFHWIPFSAFESPECVAVVRGFVTENNVPLVQLRRIQK